MKKGFIGWDAIVRLVIGISFAIVVIGIAKSCAETFFATSDSAVRSFEELTETIKKAEAWPDGKSETQLLIMDDKTLIIGFAKNADFVSGDYNLVDRGTEGNSETTTLTKRIIRPERACGKKGTYACLCLCKGYPQFDQEREYYVCQDLQCSVMPQQIDFQYSADIKSLIPEGITDKQYELMTQGEPKYIKNGFMIEKDKEIVEFVTKILYKEKGLGSGGIPRRFPVIIEKKSNGVAVCARAPC